MRTQLKFGSALKGSMARSGSGACSTTSEVSFSIYELVMDNTHTNSLLGQLGMHGAITTVSNAPIQAKANATAGK